MPAAEDITALTSLATTSYAFGDAPNWRALAAAKVFVPRISQNVIDRQRLIERLNSSMSSAVTLLIAPAGFGKTTLLIQWMRQTSRAVAWLSIDDHESDVSRFAFDAMVALRQAIRPKNPDFGRLPHVISQEERPLNWRVLASLLIQEFQSVDTPLTLVLDDYHFIHDESINALLALVIERLPDHVNIVISSRRIPTLPLSRLRSRGLVREIAADSLRLSAEEIERFIATTTGLSLKTSEIETLLERTEGWLAGVQLAATGLQDGATLKQLFGTSNQTLDKDDALEYLCEEVLSRQPKEVQNFLLKTSVLERFCADLCDYVMGIENSQEVFSRVQEDNLFLVALDDDGTWFRYHHLFRSLLRNRLSRLHAKVVPELQRRASLWFSDNHRLPEAVAYAVDAADWETAVDLIKPIGAPLLFAAAGRIRTWLDSLPPEALAAQPILLTWQALLALSAGNIRESERILFDLEKREGESLGPEIQIEILGIRAIAAAMSNDGPTSLVLGTRALGLVGNHPAARWRSLYCIGCGFCNLGRPAEGEKWLRESVELTRDYGDAAFYSHVQFGATVARSVAFQGRFQDALKILDMYEDMSQSRGLTTPTPVHGYRAEILWDLNELEKMESCLAKTLAAIKETGLQFRRPVYWQLMARLRHARGDSRLAIALLDDLLEWCRRNGNAGCARETALLRAEIRFAMGDTEEADARFAGVARNGPVSEIAYADEEEYRFFVRWLLAGEQSASDRALLETASRSIEILRANAIDNGRKYDAAKSDVLDSLVLQRRDKLADAIRALEAAAGFALPEGAVRVFIDDRVAIQSLLSQAERERGLTNPVRQIRDIISVENLTGPANSPPRPLVDISQREQEVLNLIAMGLTNQEIADHLVVSLNTIKTHIKNLFFKLDARSRTQAVALGREAGLI